MNVSPVTFEQAGQLRRFLLFGGIYVVLWIGTWYSARLLDSLGVVSLWFLPAGLRFCCLLVFGWHGVLLELTIQLVFALMQIMSIAGPPLGEFFSISTLWRAYNLLGSLAVSTAVIFPFRRLMRHTLDLSSPTHGALFIVAALLVSILSALVGTLGLLHMDVITSAQSTEVMAKWLTGDFIGIITLAPLLLVRVLPGLQHYLRQGRWRGPAKTCRAAQNRLTLLIVTLSLLAVFAFPWSLELNQHFPLIALLLLLPLAGIAFYYGLRAAVLTVMLLDGGLTILIALFDQQEFAFQYQFVMIAIALVGLWLGGAVEARNQLMARYRDFAGISNDLLWETGADARFTEVKGKLAEHFRLSPGQLWRPYLSDCAQTQMQELDTAVTQKAPFHQLELAFRDKDGAIHWILLNGLPLFNELGELGGYRGTAVDVTRARKADELLHRYNEELRTEVAERTLALSQSNSELETKERRLQVLLAAVPVGVLEIDATQYCRFINVNGCALTGRTQEQALGLPLLEFVHPDDRDYVQLVWTMNRQSDTVQWLEFKLNHTGLRCAAHWINVSHSGQAVDGVIMVLTNTTARHEQDERLWTLAHHDALTRLPNRNLFWDRVGQALSLAKRHENGAAMLWIDLDGFKAVNDEFGHAAGDLVLQQVAERLKVRARDSDTVARMGGDEFAVILPGICDAEAALQFASEQLASIAEAFVLPQGSALISSSIGIALYPQHGDTVEALTQCADMAMYAAKRAGKNQVKVFPAS